LLKISEEKLDMLPEKAEIIGFLCAEGSHYKYDTSYYQYFKNRNKSYPIRQKIEAVEFTNNNRTLQRRFANLIKTVYNYKLNVHGVTSSQKITIKRKNVIKDLLSYTDFGCLRWNIPNEISKGSNEIKRSFIRGFFDGDGSADRRRIRFASVNLKALKKLKKILESFNFNPKIYGPYKSKKKNRKDIYEIYLMKKEEVNKFISFIKPNKLLSLGGRKFDR